MCRVYDVSREGYQSWRRRGTSARKIEDGEIFTLINQVFNRHKGHYGSPKITRELRKQGFRVGQKRVARLMREHGLRATKARIYRTKAFNHAFQKASPCLIDSLVPKRLNELWVGDVTYIRMPDDSWQYLSVIMDRFSRRIVAWSLSDKRNAELTCKTLIAAVKNRRLPKDLIFHSDKGIEYIAKPFKKVLNSYGIRPSMNGVKKMNDNAHIESFFQDFKTESIKVKVYQTVDQLRAIISQYMRYYNFERSLSVLEGMTPVEFEGKMNS